MNPAQRDVESRPEAQESQRRHKNPVVSTIVVTSQSHFGSKHQQQNYTSRSVGCNDSQIMSRAWPFHPEIEIEVSYQSP